MEATPILEPGCKPGPHTPPDLRLNFVVKVYGIVFTMLAVTFGITFPFVFHEEATKAWVKEHMWVIVVAFVFLLVQHVLHMCMAMEQCCGGSALSEAYIKMFVTVPWNYLYLMVYAACMGVVVGIICTAYKMASVCMIFCLTAAIIVGLTCYAFYTKADFTDMGAYIFVALLAFMLVSFLGIFFPIGSVFHRIIAGFGAMLFGFIIVYDTQLIFGESSAGGERTLQYTIDMYAFAAFELYLDFINFFLYMLQFLGDRD